MAAITFADVVHQIISFSHENPSEALVLELIDTPWFQRLRDISQTANTRLVYMFSEHSRFGHCVGVAYLASVLMNRLQQQFGTKIEKYRSAVCAAAILHDIGHLAPGSHTAYKTWFPEQPDTHEEVAMRIIREDPSINAILQKYSSELSHDTCAILSESADVPAWAWEIISGGGWNVDRGNWCIVDSIMAGVSYGRYNIPALIESITITDEGHLAVMENRLDAMMHFAVSRHALYRQMYQHRVMLACDTLHKAVVLRARDMGAALPFADQHMKAVLQAHDPSTLTLETLFAMRESWWKYHLMQWSKGKDSILADLSRRLLNRDLFKTVRIHDIESRAELHRDVSGAVQQAGYDPRYYLHEVSTPDMHENDFRQSMLVVMEDGQIKPLSDADPLFKAMLRDSKSFKKSWLAMPKEAKALLGRER